jgi:hypothetical protein
MITAEQNLAVLVTLEKLSLSGQLLQARQVIMPLSSFLSSGNLLIHGALTASKVIASGDILKIAVGDMDITAA